MKCRPPDNRDPEPEEIAALAPYLDKEIEVLDPKLIITLDDSAWRSLSPMLKLA